MISVYDEIEQAVEGRVFLGVGLSGALSQIEEWVDYEYVRALMDSTLVDQQNRRLFPHSAGFRGPGPTPPTIADETEAIQTPAETQATTMNH